MADLMVVGNESVALLIRCGVAAQEGPPNSLSKQLLRPFLGVAPEFRGITTQSPQHAGVAVVATEP